MTPKPYIRFLLLAWAALFCLPWASPARAAGSGLAGSAAGEGSTPDISSVIQELRSSIPERMRAENVPGLALVVVDESRVLWAEGFGYADPGTKTAATPATPFSIQSMSKAFAATAVLLAVQDGLVDLDEPISTYLPDFHVNSIFEEHPEQKITLRLLLSHTAGLAHEASIGGNFDLPGHTFEQHIASISDTWLKSPVGQRYSYSNLGVDLAGYIVQVRSGKPYAQYVKEKIFGPLGMNSSSADINAIWSLPGRAIGRSAVPYHPPVESLIIPSGGIYSTAEDMGRFLRFQINRGALDGARLLSEGLAEAMIIPPNLPSQMEGYALGIAVTRQHDARRLQHGGGGFGFNSNMIWYPELKLGAAVLTNAEHDNLYWQLNEEILDKIIALDPGLYARRAQSSPEIRALDTAALPLSNGGLQKLIAEHALPEDAAAAGRRQAYAGDYIVTKWGAPAITLNVSASDGKLTAAYLGETLPLTEVQPGVFYTPSGEVLNLGVQPPTGQGIPLIKVDYGALALRTVVYALCGLFCLSAVLFWPARGILRLVRRRPGQPLGIALSWASLLAGAGGLVSLVCLAVIALVPTMIAVPWLAPYPGLTLPEQIGMRLPLIALALGAGAALLSALSWISRSAAPRDRLYFSLLSIAVIVVNLVIL